MQARSILVTGASSGIGAALARCYAAPGVSLALTGRDTARLAEVAEACRVAGAEVLAEPQDVTSAEGMARFIRAADERRPLDLVIANSGVSAGTGAAGGESAETTRAIFAVNVDGVMNTVLPAIELMRPRKHGQIAIMSSLAGYRGLAGAPAYCASKAAVKAWGEGLRGWLAADGVRVSVICPGFVTSRMTAVNNFPMPFLMSADQAAGIIRRGLARDRGRIAFPWPMAAGAWLLSALPASLVDWLGAKLPRKG